MIGSRACRVLWSNGLPRLDVFGASYERDALGCRLLQLARHRQRAHAAALAPRVAMLTIFSVLIVAVPAAWIGGHELLVPVGILTAAVSAAFLTAVALYVPRPGDVALAYDRRAQLKERLSTATAELRNVDGDIRDLQRADALAVAQHLDPSQGFPFGGLRRDLIVLTIATTALAGWIMVSTLTPFFRSVRAPLALGPGAATLSEPGGEAAELQSVMLRPAIAGEIERIQAAIIELRGQINPDIVYAQRALQEASERLRLSNEGRQLGRELGKQEYAAAADELRGLVAKLTEFNAAQRERLGQSFGESAEVASDDARLAQQFDELAEVLQGGQISDARLALSELASTLEAIADSADGNVVTQQKLSELELRLSELLEIAMLATGLPGGSEGEGLGVGGPSGLQSDGEDQPQGLMQRAARGFGDSVTDGQEMPVSIEGMTAGQRLNRKGQLETVHIEPTEDGRQTVERPVLELGTDTLQKYEPSAGDRGVAVGRPDTDRDLPADLHNLLDRYFSTS